ncbi:MAG: tRNA preQ1(34) S-adenosylmethionine ribosyltransferase-isomerase QueA [Gemmatimonadaceae bacterium]|nr:tRNA preQ1(34) S-adenosylmethionine ribosyltransferase-isomerase QueA [Gemmatimonadaceae bacterium]
MIGRRTSDYDFDLPEDRIAQTPAARRDESRLMRIDRASGTITHHRFRDLAEMIPAGDTLAVNTTRVLKARLLGTRDSGAAAEVLLLRPLGDGSWEAMVKPGAKLKPGRRVTLGADASVEILDDTGRGTRRVRFSGDPDATIERYGHVPLPPYIARADGTADAERYQTVYAKEQGSVAAPTAGLHFTPELLATLAAQGVTRTELLLHVGIGTFKPVEVEEVTAHAMHEEWYRVSEAAAARLNATRAASGRVWAVGTTSMRTLESVVDATGAIHAGEGETKIFIYPPYTFRAVDRLVTNFHLPRSTLLMLVAAFAGYDLMREAYRVAIADSYRFYSYGDAMVIV